MARKLHKDIAMRKEIFYSAQCPSRQVRPFMLLPFITDKDNGHYLSSKEAFAGFV